MRDYYDCHDWDIDGFPGEFVYGDDCYVDDYYMDERWKRVQGFRDYWVSDHGRVYGPGGKIRRGGFLTLVETPGGYYKVTLACDNYRVERRVNRLVAEAFIPNPHNLPIVMHMDNDRLNNHVDNLKWGTHAENNRYCWDCGRHPVTLTDEDRERAYATRRTPVIAINMYTGERSIFASQHEAARALGVMQQHIWGVLKGIRRSTGSYRFEYLCEEEFPDGY